MIFVHPRNLLAASLILLASVVNADVMIEATPSAVGPLDVGDTFTITLSLSNNTITDAVDGVIVWALYDDTSLEFVSATGDVGDDSYLNPLGGTQDSPFSLSTNQIFTRDAAGFPGTGIVNYQIEDSDSPTSANGTTATGGTLGTLTFRATSAMTSSTITFTEPGLDLDGTSQLRVFNGVTGNPIVPGIVTPATVTVVPEPSSFLFFAMIAIGGCGRRWYRKYRLNELDV